MRNHEELKNLDLEIKNASTYLDDGAEKLELLRKFIVCASNDKDFNLDAGDLRGLDGFLFDICEQVDMTQARLDDARLALEALKAANPDPAA